MVRHRSAIALNISAFLLMFGVGMIVSLLPGRIIHLSGAVSDVGHLASAFALTFVLCQIPIGRLSDTFGFKKFLVIGYGLCALSGLVFYIAASTRVLMLGRMLQGIGEVPVWALAPALLAIQHPGRKGWIIGVYNASVHCGLMLGSLAGIFVQRLWQGNEPFLLFAALSLLGGLLIAAIVKDPAQRPASAMTRAQTGDGSSLLKRPALQVLLPGIILYGAGYGIFITTIPAFLISARGAGQTTVGVFFMLFYIAVSLSQLIGGKLSDRTGRIPIMLWGLIMAGSGLAVFSGCPLPWLMGFLFVAALGLGTFCVAAMAFLNERIPDGFKGRLAGVFYFTWGAGYFSGPLIFGRLEQPEFWQAGFRVFAGCFLLEFIVCACLLVGPWQIFRTKHKGVQHLIK